MTTQNKWRKQFYLQQHKINLGRNLTKEVRDTYTESFKAWIKENEEHLNKWKDTLHSWFNLFKISTLT